MPADTRTGGAAHPVGPPLDKARAALRVAHARTNAMLDGALIDAGDDRHLIALARQTETVVHAFRELALDLRVLTLEQDPLAQS